LPNYAAFKKEKHTLSIKQCELSWDRYYRKYLSNSKSNSHSYVIERNSNRFVLFFKFSGKFDWYFKIYSL